MAPNRALDNLPELLEKKKWEYELMKKKLMLHKN